MRPILRRNREGASSVPFPGRRQTTQKTPGGKKGKKLSRADLSHMLAVLRGADRAFWRRALVWGGAIALVIGIPTVLLPNPFFTRMIATSFWQYPVWGLIIATGGLTMAARKLPGRTCSVEGKTVVGGGLAYLAVACPICNKIVIGLIGTSGALSYFAPLQPALAAGALVLMLVALRTALRAASPAVPVPTGIPPRGP